MFDGGPCGLWGRSALLAVPCAHALCAGDASTAVGWHAMGSVNATALVKHDVKRNEPKAKQRRARLGGAASIVFCCHSHQLSAGSKSLVF